MSSQKHIMLSYQWDHQKLVTEVYRRLKEINIPLWMDTQGGMKGHLSDSMAAGVENAAAICCFLTPKYQDSVACKDELTYAKEQRVCIIPILVVPNWKPTGWLGFTIAGHKWIHFRDIDTNLDSRMQQLVAEIQMLVGDKLSCFQGVKQLNLIDNANKEVEDQNEKFSFPTSEEEDFDPNSYYRLTTEWQGDNKSLGIVNDSNNNQLILAKTDDNSGQYWKITPNANGFHRLTTQSQGEKKSLDVVNDGKNNNKLILATTGDYSGQCWKITPNVDGFYRLTTQWQGDKKSLDVVNDGKNNNQLILATTGNYSGQRWKITKV